MDPIKEAFFRIKEDITQLKEEIAILRIQLKQTQTTPTHNPTKTPRQTDIPTHIQTTPTHNYQVEPLYTPNSNSSIGNGGVPTDRQTDRQTDQQTHNLTHIQTIPHKNQYQSNQSNYSNSPQPQETDFKQANNMLSELDSIKKGIRLKFKRLTPQEMLVFSHLYALEDQNIEEITYRKLATQLSLSESSIRDYTNKLIKKGVPITKLDKTTKP